MRQTITEEQLQELSKEGKKKLEYWCFENRYFTKETTPFIGPVARFTDTKTGTHYIIEPPLISIGQMIEFLEQKGEFGQILHLLGWTGAYCSWRVTNRNGIPALDTTNANGRVEFNELCDALWENVKKVLE